LDAAAVHRLLTEAIDQDGVLATWEGLVCPVLRAVGERWIATHEGIEVEHLLAETAGAVLRSRTTPTDPGTYRPVIIACAPMETHALPLYALHAALAERSVTTRCFGASLPAEALVAAVRRSGPAAVLIYSHQPATAEPAIFTLLPTLRPATVLLAGGPGWSPDRLPTRVAYVHELPEAVHLIQVATGTG
jgi:hypothetical protein